jgi:hypothetical protein
MVLLGYRHNDIDHSIYLSYIVYAHFVYILPTTFYFYANKNFESRFMNFPDDILGTCV